MFTPNGLMLVNSSKIQRIPMQIMMESIPLMILSETKTKALELNRTVTWIRLLMEMKTLKGITTDGGPRTVTQLQDRLLDPCFCTTLNYGSTITQKILHTTYWPINYGAQYFRLRPQVARMFCTGVDDDAEGVILEFPILCMYYILATSGRLNGFGTR